VTINLECYRLNYQFANEINSSGLHSMFEEKVGLRENVAHGKEGGSSWPLHRCTTRAAKSLPRQTPQLSFLKMRVVRAKPHADWTIWWIITRVAKAQGCIIRIATRGDRADGGSSYRRKEAPCMSLLDLF